MSKPYQDATRKTKREIKPVSAPMPIGRYRNSWLAKLRDTLQSMNVGDCFSWDGWNKHVYLAAKQTGIKVKTRKMEDGTFRVWKIT